MTFKKNWYTKTDAWIRGYEQAEKEFMDENTLKFDNPYHPGSDEFAGYEEAVYDFTQK